MNGAPLDYEDYRRTVEEVLVPQISALIEHYIGRKIKQAVYTEYHPGTGTSLLTLRQRPVSSIATLYLDEAGVFGSETLLVPERDYSLRLDQPDGSSRSGVVVRLGGTWPRPVVHRGGQLSPQFGDGTEIIKVTYTAGYATLPPDLQLAVTLMIPHVRQLDRKGALVQSESHADVGYSYTLAVPDGYDIFPPHVKRILARYRNNPVG